MDESEWPMLTDGRVVLRVLCADDVDPWMAGEDDEQRRWFDFPGPAPRANVVAAVERWRRSWLEDGDTRHWGVWVDGGLAGGVELRSGAERRVDVSYVVFPARRRRGVATAAVRLATSWAFEHLGAVRVVAIVHPDNVASTGVTRAVGFVDDGWAEPWEHSEPGRHRRFVLRRSPASA